MPDMMSSTMAFAEAQQVMFHVARYYLAHERDFDPLQGCIHGGPFMKRFGVWSVLC